MADKFAEIARETACKLPGLYPGSRTFDGVVEVLASALRAAVQEEREACAAECDRQREVYGTTEYATHQPLSSFGERFACVQLAQSIRSRSNP